MNTDTRAFDKVLLLSRRFVWLYLFAYFFVTLIAGHHELNGYQLSDGVEVLATISFFLMLFVFPVVVVFLAVNNLHLWRGILALTLFSIACLSIAVFENLDTTPNHGGEYLEWGIVLFGPVGLTVAALHAYNISRVTLANKVNSSSMNNAANFSRRLNPILITITLVMVIIYIIVELI